MRENGMTPYLIQERIREHEAEAKRLREQLDALQEKCKHVWDEPIYDPLTVTRCYRIAAATLLGEGDGWTEELKPRWSRTCSNCTKKEYTENQKAVHYEPDFDNPHKPFDPVSDCR
jgi:hypothetical protein